MFRESSSSDPSMFSTRTTPDSRLSINGLRYGMHAVIVLRDNMAWFRMTGSHSVLVGSEDENALIKTVSCAMVAPTTLFLDD
jgi:hypothetical protein